MEKLQALGLSEETLAPVLALWEETEQHLRQETEALRTARRLDELERKLLARGATPALVPLLLKAAPDADPEQQAAQLRQDYPCCFAEEHPEPLPETAPPTGTSGGRLDALRAMSPEEINRSWEEIRAELTSSASRSLGTFP